MYGPCNRCGREIDYTGVDWFGDAKGYFHKSCPSAAERSEVLQGCPPSATGSADARAADEAAADSSGRSADEAVRALVGKWKVQSHNLFIGSSLSINTRASRIRQRHQGEIYAMCAAELDASLSPALRAQPERARQPNDVISDQGAKTKGANALDQET